MQSLRLQKFLADQGLCSRRTGETWILEGQVSVNGKVASLGQKVDPEQDTVRVGKRIIRPKDNRSITLAMNKPRGLLCSNQDPHHPGRTVFDHLPPRWQQHRLFCAGRLDKDSEGLVILTNDGELAQTITHPSKELIKRYQVKVSKDFDPELIPALLKGRKVEGEHLKFERVIPATRGPDAKRLIEVHLKQGRKREIRRLLEAHRTFVKRLKRIQIGQYRMMHLAPGAVRELGTAELKRLLKNPRP